MEGAHVGTLGEPGPLLARDCLALGEGLLQFVTEWETGEALAQVRSLRTKLRREWARANSFEPSPGMLAEAEAEARRLVAFDVWMELGRLEVVLACYASQLRGRVGEGEEWSLKALAQLDWVLDDVLMSSLLASQRTCGDLRWPRLLGSERLSASRTWRGPLIPSQWGTEAPRRILMARQASADENEAPHDVVIGWPRETCLET